jgi:hypothetical protein
MAKTDDLKARLSIFYANISNNLKEVEKLVYEVEKLTSNKEFTGSEAQIDFYNVIEKLRRGVADLVYEIEVEIDGIST